MATNVDDGSIYPRKFDMAKLAKLSLLAVAGFALLLTFLAVTGGPVDEIIHNVDPWCAGETNPDGSCIIR